MARDQELRQNRLIFYARAVEAFDKTDDLCRQC